MNRHVQAHTELTDPQPISTAHLFSEILEGLIRSLSALEVADWSLPTACAGWSVHDVALHLLGVEIGNLSARRDAHRLGTALSGWDALVAHVNDWNQEWVSAGRRISPRLLVELLEFIGGETGRYFQSLDPFETGGPISWAGPEPQPVWLDVAREFTERWHHQQHIRDAVGRPGMKGPRYFQPALATLSWGMPHAFRMAEAPVGARVTLTLTGDSGGSWTIVRRAGSWYLYQGRARQPDASVTLDQDLAWRLFTKGIPPSQARGAATVEGDRSLAEPLFKMVSIIA
jgi:uncharacterized protein (TIGR03083 family)